MSDSELEALEMVALRERAANYDKAHSEVNDLFEKIGAACMILRGEAVESRVRNLCELTVLATAVKERLETLEAAVRKVASERGDDRCWMDLRELFRLVGCETDAALQLPPPEEMLANCKRFIASCHDPALPYVSPQREIERLQRALERYGVHRHGCTVAPCSCGFWKEKGRVG